MKTAPRMRREWGSRKLHPDGQNGPGVYAIVNTISGRTYVGATVGKIVWRWRAHRKELVLGKHLNGGMQADWNADGESAFEFRVLEATDTMRLEQVEQAWIDTFKANPGGVYNIRPADFVAAWQAKCAAAE